MYYPRPHGARQARAGGRGYGHRGMGDGESAGGGHVRARGTVRPPVRGAGRQR